MRRHLCILLALLCPATGFSQSAFNQNPANQVAKAPGFQAVPLLIEYRPTDKPSKESLTVRLRESGSGAQASVALTSQPNDPAIYQGLFYVQFPKGDRTDKVLEFSDGKGKTFLAWQKMEGRTQSVRLVDNETEWRKLVEQAEKSAPAVKAAVAPSPEEIARREQAAREQARREEQARVDLERQEALKREEAIRQQAALSAAQKQKRKNEAAAVGNEALEAYLTGEFEKASKLFAKAIEMDPENDKYYHQYGISLYKIGNYSSSLAMFSMAEGDQSRALERSYYIALNQMKLKEYDKALKELNDIRDEKNPELSPISAYFAGTIEFRRQNFQDARKNFEFVLDNSNDPKLDEQAEQMLEQLDRAESFMSSSRERFRVTATIGAIYDSNVLSISQQNLATDTAAYRANYGATILTNLYRSYPSELGLQLGVNDYYSVDKNFKGEATLQTADALEWAALLPYKTQLEASSRTYFFDVTPAAKSLYMAPTGGTRKSIASTALISANMTTALNNLWMVRAGLELGSDKFTLDVPEEDDQSGSRITVNGSLTRLLDLKGATSLTGDLSYTDSKTKGTNYISKKSVLAATYGFPLFKSSLGAFRLEYTNQAYPQALVDRTDKITSATLSAMTPLNKSWNLAVTAMGSTSDSQVELYKYDKYMVSALLTYTLSILKD